MFSESNFYIYVTQYGKENSPIASLAGDYVKVNSNQITIQALLLESINGNDPFTERADIFNNFKSFLNNTYKNNKIKSAWIQVGITTGVNAGITIILSLVVFLMTRGKNNPNRVIKWYQCFLICFYAALCPGLLTLIFGFLLSGMEIMLYVLTFGVRVMWMSVRNLRPAIQ